MNWYDDDVDWDGDDGGYYDAYSIEDKDAAEDKDAVEALGFICDEFNLNLYDRGSTWHVQAGEKPGDLVVTAKGKDHRMTIPTVQWAALMKKLTQKS